MPRSDTGARAGGRSAAAPYVALGLQGAFALVLALVRLRRRESSRHLSRGDGAVLLPSAPFATAQPVALVPVAAYVLGEGSV